MNKLTQNSQILCLALSVFLFAGCKESGVNYASAINKCNSALTDQTIDLQEKYKDMKTASEMETFTRKSLDIQKKHAECLQRAEALK